MFIFKAQPLCSHQCVDIICTSTVQHVFIITSIVVLHASWIKSGVHQHLVLYAYKFSWDFCEFRKLMGVHENENVKICTHTVHVCSCRPPFAKLKSWKLLGAEGVREIYVPQKFVHIRYALWRALGTASIRTQSSVHYFITLETFGCDFTESVTCIFPTSITHWVGVVASTSKISSERIPLKYVMLAVENRTVYGFKFLQIFLKSSAVTESILQHNERQGMAWVLKLRLYYLLPWVQNLSCYSCHTGTPQVIDTLGMRNTTPFLLSVEGFQKLH